MSGTQTFPQALHGGEGAVCGHRVGSQGVSLGHHGRWNKDPQERPLRSELERMQPTLSQLSGEIEDWEVNSEVSPSADLSHQRQQSKQWPDQGPLAQKSEDHQCLRGLRTQYSSYHSPVPYGVRERRRELESVWNFSTGPKFSFISSFSTHVWELRWSIRSVLGKQRKNSCFHQCV